MTLRVVQIDGEPWFVAPDAVSAMGYTKKSSSMILKKLSDDERGKTNLPCSKGGVGTGIISESGLYKLITRSDKPEAKPFQEWVTRDVLPSIRKDNGLEAHRRNFQRTEGRSMKDTIKTPEVGMNKKQWGIALAVVFFGPTPFLGWMEDLPHILSLLWFALLVFTFFKWNNAYE